MSIIDKFVQLKAPPPFQDSSHDCFRTLSYINIMEKTPSSLNAFHYRIIHRFRIARVWRGRIICKEAFFLL